MNDHPRSFSTMVTPRGTRLACVGSVIETGGRDSSLVACAARAFQRVLEEGR